MIKLVFVGVALLLLRAGIWWWQVTDELAPCAAQFQWITLDAVQVSSSGSRQRLDGRVASSKCPALVGQRVRLGWYVDRVLPPQVEHLRAEVKLRQPWGSLNHGGFNYRVWLLSRGYYATGYVRRAEWLSPSPKPHASTSELLYPELLRALSLGEKHGVTSEQWALFRQTGTTHLMVVSGLHVGIFAGLCAAFLGGVARLLQVGGFRVHPRQLSLLGAAAAAILFAWITGMQAPVMRAALMVSLCSLALLLSRRVPAHRALLAAAYVSVWLEPGMLLRQGFWLSYAAVLGLLIWFAPRVRRPSGVAALLQAQVVAWLGLTPWLGVIVGAVPWYTAANNLLAVPLMTLLGIPAAMCGVGLQALGWSDNPLLQVADFSLHVLLALLSEAPTPDTGYFLVSAAVIALGISVYLSLPLARWQRGALIVCWCCLFARGAIQVPEGEVQVVMLDVGQGSAALVFTRQHQLVIDTGASFKSGFNMAAAAVVPALRKLGRDHVDKILISHFDNDHAGGLPTLRERYPGAAVISPFANCTNGTAWVWDEVRFELLRHAKSNNRNDNSCTLVIRTRGHTAYFPGDIGQISELALLRHLPRKVDLLLAPHHGSSSSSHPAFVARLRPDWVVFSAGRNNRYQHPHADVVLRYRQVGTMALNTAEQGAVEWHSARHTLCVQRRQLLARWWPWTHCLGADNTDSDV